MEAAAKLFGAVILRPYLATRIPFAVHSRFSCYGLFIVKACGDGWGIEGIRRALDGFGLDGGGIVSTCLGAVRCDPVSAFWMATRHLCEVINE